MTQQLIVTAPANTGLGSSPKTAFDFCNANFTELYARANVPVINPAQSPFNADPTGNADSSPAFNAAIAAAAAAGGGEIVPTPGTYKLGSTVFQATGVVVFSYGSTFTWSGGASPMISMPTTGTTSYAGWFGGVLNDGGNASVMLGVNSGYSCWYRDLQFLGNSLTNTCIALTGNSSGSPVNPTGNYNTAQCYFENMSQSQSSGGVGNGTFVSITGVSTAVGLSTDNTFHNIQSQRVNQFGLVGGQACDSNVFTGMTRISLNGNISPANGIGLAWGTTGAGVYSWTFQHLAIDTFGNPAVDNRQGVVANYGNGPKNLKIGVLFMGPQVEANVFTAANTSSLLSCDVTVAPRATTNYQSKNLLGSNIGLGILANNAATSIAGVGAWLVGASQYAYFANASCFNTATALSASYGTTPGAAAAAGPYTVAGVAGFAALPGVNGANATTTNGYGFYCADQTFGGTNNYGYYLTMASGAGKFGFFSAGNVANNFAGPTAVGGTITNDNAAAGFVGEVITATVGSGSALALTTTVGLNVTSISLTAGDWDVTGNVAFLPAATTNITYIAGSCNTTSATIGSFATQASGMSWSGFVPGVVTSTQAPPRQRLSLNATTTVFLVAQATFTVAGLSAFGSITARRRR